MSRKSIVVAVLMMGGLLMAPFAIAQTNYGLHEKGIERLNAARNVAPLSVDTIFGDQISRFNGGAEFTNVDISVPGNNNLPVELRRTLKVDDRSKLNGLHLGGFAEWDLDIPHLSGVFSLGAGWRPQGGTVNQRCSSPSGPGHSGGMAEEDYWNGYQLHMPGVGDQALLMTPSSMLPAAGGGPYPWITKGMWRISCKSATKNGYAGQSFVAHSPQGVKYHLDWVITKSHAGAKNEGTGGAVARQVIYFLASRVEDRFGNWVDYAYSGDKLTSITSSDGRQINLTYTGNKVTSISSSVGSWSYSYVGDKLSQVTQPDGSKWAYASTGGLAVYPPTWTPTYEDPTGCPEALEAPIGSYGLTITAPSGAVGQFTFDVRQHQRSSVPDTCIIVPPSYYYVKVPRQFWSLTLISKTVTGPGLPSMSWGYTYGQPNIFYGDDTKQTTASGPNNTWERYTFGTGVDINEGQLLKVERGSGPGNVLQVQTNTYVTTAEAASQNFPSTVGYNPLMYADKLASQWLRPVKQKVTSQQGINFTWQLNICASKYCTDVFGNPTSVTKASTLPGSPSKVVATEYEHNTSYWVLGQVKKTTEGTTVASETIYNLMGLPEVMTSFGKVKQTLGYYTDGTVATVKDGNNNTVTLSSWYRGIPRSIAYPDSTGQSATVSAAGWVTSVTDQNGYVTGYGYDAMGRLASVVYPTSDTTAWNTTTQVFQQVAGAEYGIPAGHWRQTVSTGNARKITYYDGLWRPLVTREYDTANETATKRFQRFTYDHAGRTTFASYPGTTDVLSTGTWTEYDALGRPTSLGQDSELGVLTTLTAYQAGFKTLVTSPKGLQTTTSFLAWDSPTTEFPVQIVQPAGAVTDIVRETIFGKPTALTRRNAGGTVSLTRSYLYNAYQELCRSVEPETGATLMGYDNAGNLTWSAGGLPASTACHDTGLIPAIQPSRVARMYNNRNLLTSLSFPDGVGNQGWTYTPDGLPDVVTTYNSTGGSTVTNAYSYNKRRMLVGEAMTRGAGTPWSIGYGYDGNGSASTLVYPSGLTISFVPNALGQPTQAGSYATGVQYYPNGAIKQFSYGNGIVHNMVQNARQLPASSTDCTVAGDYCSSGNKRMDLRYTYDPHGNVSELQRYDGGWQLQTMAYDELDRLIQSISPMFGTASYTYDVLDNLMTTQVTAGSNARNHTYVYEASSNRLTQIKQTVGGTVVANLGYDVRGNLASKGAQTYQFDYGNRLRNVPGKETGYQYDALGRRVYGSTTGSSYIVSQYSQAGVLLYQQDYKQAKRLEYVYLGGSLIAFRETPHGTSTTVVKYQHTDALGSPVAVTDAAKAIVQTSEYEPYGQLVNRAPTDGPGFTGHVQDAATGLTYMQQRYYDPTVGRFLSVDPVTALSSPVGMFNRYKYAANNPYRFVDPDGRQEKEEQERQRTDFRSMSSHPGAGGMPISGVATASMLGSSVDGSGGKSQSGSSFPSSQAGSIERKEGESEKDFVVRAGDELRRLRDSSGHEYCTRACPSGVVPIYTSGSHVVCAQPSGCGGPSIHIHGKDNFKVNAIDNAYMKLQGIHKYSVGDRGPGQSQDTFSDADYSSGPGYLIGDKAVYYQEGRGTNEKIHEYPKE